MLVVEAVFGFAGSVSSMTIILPSTLLLSREIQLLFITQLLNLDNVKQFPGRRAKPTLPNATIIHGSIPLDHYLKVVKLN